VAEIPVVIYAAKSTPDDKDSIATQVAQVTDAIQREGDRTVVASPFTEANVSGYRGDRGPVLEKAKDAATRAAAEAGHAELWVWHSSRLGRGSGRKDEARSVLEIFTTLRRQGVALRSVQDDAYVTDEAFVGMAAKMAHKYSEDLSGWTKAGKRRRFERGDSSGPLAFGYKLVDVAEGDRITKRRVPDPDEAAVVVEMFRMLDGGHGIGEITRWVNGQGIRTKRGNPFGRSRTREILSNPWYGGKVRSQGELRDGNHEPLLAWSEFERIRAKLRRNDPVSTTKRKGGRPSGVALLSGVAFCADCGHGIWHRKSGKRRSYVCGNVRHATGACKAAKFDAVRTEEALVAHLDTLFVDFQGWLEDLTRQQAAQRDALVQELAVLHDQRATLASDEGLVRADYMRQLRAGNERAAELATGELERIADESGGVEAALRDLNARLDEWDQVGTADAMLDWWSEFSAAIRGDVVNATSVREANTALRERFAAIYVKTRGGTTRLDFVLKDREVDAPLVSSTIWSDAVVPDDGTLINFIHNGPAPHHVRPVETDRLTLV